MKLGAVVSACDTHPKYLQCIPVFCNAWKKLFPEVQVIILLVAKEIPPDLLPFAHYILRVDPIEGVLCGKAAEGLPCSSAGGVHTALHAQCIRLYAPRDLETQDAVMITDIDMIPMNRRYYEEGLSPYSNETIVAFRKGGYPITVSDGRKVDALAMCYIAATPSGWKALVGTESTTDRLRTIAARSAYSGSHGGQGWFTDQWILTDAFATTKAPTALNNDFDLFFQRLDRIDPTPLFSPEFRPMLQQAIHSGFYCDYHLHHPVQDHMEFIEFVLDSLPPDAVQ